MVVGDLFCFSELLNWLFFLLFLWFEYECIIYSFVLIRKGSDLVVIEVVSNIIDGVEYVNILVNVSKVLKV